MKKKILAILLISAMFIMTLAACGGSGGDNGGDSNDGGSTVNYDDGYPANVLRITYQADPESADPAETTADYILMLNCMDTLLQVETNDAGENEFVPDLAESYTVSDDGLNYTFQLRQGVKFHNGEEFTSDDVLYTVDRMLQPDRAGVNASWMTMVKGGQDMLDGKIDTVENVGITCNGDYEVTITLEQAYAPFIAMVASAPWSICNREAGDAADEAGGGRSTSLYGSDPQYFAGTGPFKLSEWALNDHVYLETFQDYWKGASTMDGILIKVVPDASTEKMMFDSGQIDVFDLDHSLDSIPEYRDSEEWKDNISEKTVLGTSYLSINEGIEPLNDVRVRKALQMAIDRDTIISDLYYGAATPAEGFLPEGVPGYNADLEPIEYDPEGAKALLAEAGYADGFDLVITQTNDASQNDIEINEFIRKNFEDIGINATIEQYDNATWYSVRATGELPMYRTSWTADFNDPDNFLYQMYGGANNVARSWNYTNQDALDRLEKARYITDPDARAAEYAELDKIITRDDAAMIPLWHRTKIRVLQDRVKGFVPMWAGYGDCSYYGVSLEG